jgi:hypothetical protein
MAQSPVSSALHLHTDPNTFYVLEDRDSSCTLTATSDLTGVNVTCTACGVLQEASINLGPGIKSATVSTTKFSCSPSGGKGFDVELGKLQVGPANAENSIDTERPTPRRLRIRPAIGSQTFEPLDIGRETFVLVASGGDSPAAEAEHQLEPIQEEVSQLSCSHISRGTPSKVSPIGFHGS